MYILTDWQVNAQQANVSVFFVHSFLLHSVMKNEGVPSLNFAENFASVAAPLHMQKKKIILMVKKKKMLQ